MITVNLEKFTLTKSITNLTCKNLMKFIVLLNLILQKKIYHVCLMHFGCLTKWLAAKEQL